MRTPLPEAGPAGPPANTIWRPVAHAPISRQADRRALSTLSGGATLSESIYAAVTARIIEALEQGVIPWRKPWDSAAALPCNAVSKRPYRGINLLLLGLRTFADNRWLTYRQAKALGGSVRRGEKSTAIVFWKPLEVKRANGESGEVLRQHIPLLRYYHVFNAGQCEDLPLPPIVGRDNTCADERIAKAEGIVRSMPDPPSITEYDAAAWYRPKDDNVGVPPPSTFERMDSYYATLFHELGHSTGHAKRLNRPGVAGKIEFASSAYSREELIAELTSAFCCAKAGLDNSLITDSASYINCWLPFFHEDSKAVVVAAFQAQKAADYIQNVTEME
jgi:antirestriction protein ArdC